MKLLNYFLLFLLCSYTTIIAQTIPKKGTNQKASINKLINNWHKAASDANFDNYFNAMDKNSVFVGTDANEVWNKKTFKNFSKPFFDKGKAWSFKTLQRNIYLHSSLNIAWFDETLQTWMGICRGSGVVEKTNNIWKIKHYVLSVTVPNEDIKPIVEIKKERDSLFLKNLQN